MKITCTTTDVAVQVVRVLNQHGVARGIAWQSPDGLDTATWVIVNTAIDPATEPSIRRDIAAIAGATVQE